MTGPTNPPPSSPPPGWQPPRPNQPPPVVPPSPGPGWWWDGYNWREPLHPPKQGGPWRSWDTGTRIAAIVGGCIAIIAAIVVITGANKTDDSDRTSPTAKSSSSGEEQKYAAFDICKDFVKDRLKSPSSATFRNFFEDDGEVVVTGDGDGPYEVASSVDSENSFGAKLRSTFTCNVTNDTGSHWVLNSINIEDN